MTDNKFLPIISERRTIKIELERVLYFEKNLRKLLVHMEEGQLEFYSRFKDIEEYLGENFYHCHKSYYVNLDKVVRIEPRTYWFEGGKWVPISQLKYKEAKERYQNYLRELCYCPPARYK